MVSPNRTTLLAWIVAILLYAPLARAEVGAVVVTGTLAPYQRQIVAVAAADVLRVASWTVLEPGLSVTEGDAVAACTALDRPWTCVADATRGKALDRVMVIDVRPDRTQNGRLAVTVQLLAAGNGVATAEGTHCAQQCTEGNLKAATTEIVSRALRTAAERTATSGLEIRSTPAGAAIKVDGRLVGTTNQTIATTPGTHTIEIELDGFQRATRTTTVADGAREPIEVTLVPAAGSPMPPRPRRVEPPSSGGHSRALPLATAVIGAACFAGGWLYTKTRDPSDGFAQPERLTSTPAVAVSVAGGVALVGGAVWLWLWWPHDARRASVPTVSVQASEATLGWATRF